MNKLDDMKNSNIRKMIKVIASITILLFIGTCIKIDSRIYFSGKSRGKTMIRQLRYGRFEIWDGFKEDIEYKFGFFHEEEKNLLSNKNISININMKLRKETFKGINVIYMNDINEYKEYQHNISNIKTKNIKVNDKRALLVTYNFGDSAQFQEIAEMVYIEIEKEKLIHIKVQGFKNLFESGRKIWEEFYTTFRTDQSLPYKTDFGSFKDNINGVQLQQDFTTFFYSMEVQGENSYKYSISINYINDPEEMKKNDIEKYFNVNLATDKSISSYNVKKQNLKCDGKDAVYCEVFIRKEAKTELGADLSIFGNLNPGLEVEVSSNDGKLFEFYRGEMELLMQSFKFDK
jgi:hypothetical protein